jgi:perosamine synthetase
MIGNNMGYDGHLKYSNEAVSNALVMLRGDAFAGANSPDWVAQFEDAFKRVSGHSHNIAVNSGTSGLHAALVALGVGPGDEVIMPAMSVVMNAYAALAVGAAPVFADIDRHTWNVTLESIEAVVTERTRAIITVSWFGLPVDLAPIMEYASKRGIGVVEDAAESLGSSYRGSPSGSIADLAVFSFESKKHLSCGGEGGMISTSDEALATRARKFAGLGYRHLTADAGRTSLASSVFQRPDYARYDTVSLNYRMSPLAAAVGLGQLAHFERLIGLRVEAGRRLIGVISSNPNFVAQSIPPATSHAYYTAAFSYRGTLPWRGVYERVGAQGGDGFYGCVLNPYLEPVFKSLRAEGRSWSPGLCPVAEELQPTVMALKTDYRDPRDLDRNLIAWERVLSEFPNS